MPLYLDFHKLETSDISTEELHETHNMDLAAQAEFGVTELKYWVNLEAQNLFCLVRAPNKEACNKVHENSHGNTACNIIEVSEAEFNLYFGVGHDINELAHTEAGEFDTGFRTILLLSHTDFTGQSDQYLNEVIELIEAHNGVRVIYPEDDILVSFIYASDAILCAQAIRKLLKSIPNEAELNLTLVSGRPVDEVGNEMFEEAKKKAHCITMLGSKNCMYLDLEAKALAEKANAHTNINTEDFVLLKEVDFNFSIEVFEILNNKIDQPDFKSDDLNNLLGLSKSKVYRTLKSLTGFAPNQLIQEFRLRKSLKYLRQESKSISEIAYGLGFNSPAYFTKIFRKRFNITPTHFINASKDN